MRMYRRREERQDVSREHTHLAEKAPGATAMVVAATAVTAKAAVEKEAEGVGMEVMAAAETGTASRLELA